MVDKHTTDTFTIAIMSNQHHMLKSGDHIMDTLSAVNLFSFTRSGVIRSYNVFFGPLNWMELLELLQTIYAMFFTVHVALSYIKIG